MSLRMGSLYTSLPQCFASRRALNISVGQLSPFRRALRKDSWKRCSRNPLIKRNSSTNLGPKTSGV
jgi:hypothetical protein